MNELLVSFQTLIDGLIFTFLAFYDTHCGTYCETK